MPCANDCLYLNTVCECLYQIICFICVTFQSSSCIASHCNCVCLMCVVCVSCAGRSVRVQGYGVESMSLLERLEHHSQLLILALQAGFTWVSFEAEFYVKLSVVPDRE